MRRSLRSLGVLGVLATQTGRQASQQRAKAVEKAAQPAILDQSLQKAVSEIKSLTKSSRNKPVDVKTLIAQSVSDEPAQPPSPFVTPKLKPLDEKTLTTSTESAQTETPKILNHLLTEYDQFSDSKRFDSSEEGARRISKSDIEALSTLTRSVAAAQVYLGVGVLTILTSNLGPLQAVKTVAARPQMAFEGLPPMFLYNLFAIESALAAGNSVLNAVENPSIARQLASITASAATETAVGTPFDIVSMLATFGEVKIKANLANPLFLEDLRKHHQDLFTRIIPAEMRQLSNDELSKKCSAIILKQQEVKDLQQSFPKLKITTGDIAKMSVAGSVLSTVRNLNLYLLTHLINQSNKGENKMSSLQLLAAGVAGSIITAPLNSGVYIAMTKTLEGKTIAQSMKEGAQDAFMQAKEKPMNFATIVGLRVFATLSCAAIFSEYTKEFIGKVINSIAPPCDQELQDQIDKKVEEALLNPEIMAQVKQELSAENVQAISKKAQEILAEDKNPQKALCTKHDLIKMMAIAKKQTATSEPEKAKTQQDPEQDKPHCSLLDDQAKEMLETAKVKKPNASVAHPKKGGRFASLPREVACH